MNKFQEEGRTIEYYCRRHDFSKQGKLSVLCELTNEIKKEYGISKEEDCIYRNGKYCMSLEKRR